MYKVNLVLGENQFTVAKYFDQEPALLFALLFARELYGFFPDRYVKAEVTVSLEWLDWVKMEWKEGN